MSGNTPEHSADDANEAGTSNDEQKRSRPLFDHPDAQRALTNALESLLVESDRGAVIVGMDMVDSALGELFKAIFPPFLKSKERSQLLEYPGALSSVASKAIVAAAVRMIDRTLLDAISALRKLRNVVAHSASAFLLADNIQSLHAILNLGPGVPAGVNQFACEVLLSNAVQAIRGVKVTIDDEELIPITTDQSAIDWLNNNRHVLETLNDRRPRCELAIGVGMICAMLIIRRDDITAKYHGKNSLV